MCVTEVKRTMKKAGRYAGLQFTSEPTISGPESPHVYQFICASTLRTGQLEICMIPFNG